MKGWFTLQRVIPQASDLEQRKLHERIEIHSLTAFYNYNAILRSSRRSRKTAEMRTPVTGIQPSLSAAESEVNIN